MKFKSYAIILGSCLATRLLSMDTAKKAPLFPVKKRVAVVTQDKTTVMVPELVAKHFEGLKEQVGKDGSSIDTPDVKAEDLTLLISFVEMPIQERTISLDQLLGLLAVAKSLKLDLETVNKALFKAYADTLTWDEASLAAVLNKPDSVVPEEYKDRIVEAFVRNPEKQAALVKGKERKWIVHDVDDLLQRRSLSFEERLRLLGALREAVEKKDVPNVKDLLKYSGLNPEERLRLRRALIEARAGWDEVNLEGLLKYRSLNPEELLRLIQALIEAREGLLEAIVGYENVHSYRCKQNPEMAAQCVFELFSKVPTEEDKNFIEAIKGKLEEKYPEIERKLREKYASKAIV